MSETQVKFLLGEQDIPTSWVNPAVATDAAVPGKLPRSQACGTRRSQCWYIWHHHRGNCEALGVCAWHSLVPGTASLA